MVPEHWIPHRREDGETVGWIDMESAAPQIVPLDRLGRALPPVDDWNEAEHSVESVGLVFLTDVFRYRDQRVRIRDINDDRIIVTTAMSSAVGDVGTEYELPFPPGSELRSAR